MFGQKSLPIVELLVKTKLVKSRSQAFRLIEQGGVRVQGERVGNPKAEVAVSDTIIQVGKRRFAHARSQSKNGRGVGQ